MTHRFSYSLMLLAALCAVSVGCNSNPTDMGEFRPSLYIEGYLVAGSPVDNIFVGTTMPLYEIYSRDESGITNATVALEVDDTASLLQPMLDKPGYYHLPTLQVASGKTYRLTVEVEDLTAQAETTVPYPPSVTAAATDLTLSGDPFTATWEGQTAGGYFTTKTIQDAGASIPLEELFGGRMGFGPMPGSWGFAGIDTTQFTAIRDSLASVQQWQYVQRNTTTLDWRQFYKYGAYAFLVYAIDDNYADYLISSRQDEQVLDEPRFHVSGGIGVFASMAADSTFFIVK